MIKLIVGTKGTGKTKAMIEAINAVTKTTTGNVVVLEKSMKLITGYNMMYGFVAGVLAGNYDITELFVDGILKVGDHDLNGLGKFLDDVQAIAGENVNVTITISAALETLPEDVKKYL